MDYNVYSTDGTFPNQYGYLRIRYGANRGEYSAIFHDQIENILYTNLWRSGENKWSGWKQITTNSDLSLKQLDGVDVYTLEDGRYYITNGINMPSNHPHGYVIVHRLLGDYACMFYIDPYLPDTTLAFNKQGAGTWLGWNNFMSNNVRLGDGYIQLGSNNNVSCRIYFDGSIRAVDYSLGENYDSNFRSFSLLK